MIKELKYQYNFWADVISNYVWHAFGNDINTADEIVKMAKLLLSFAFFLPVLTFLDKYGLNYEHGFIAIWGQLFMYGAKIFVIEEVGKKARDMPAGSFLMRIIVNCMMAFTSGIFASRYYTLYLASNVDDLEKLAFKIGIVTFGVGMFYEAILKEVIKVSGLVIKRIVKAAAALFTNENK